MSIAEVGTSVPLEFVEASTTKQVYAGVICDMLVELLRQYEAGELASGQGVCGNIGDWLHEWCADNDVEMDSNNPESSPYNMWYAYKGTPMNSWPLSTGNKWYPVPHPDHIFDDQRECDEDGDPPYHATWGEYAYENADDLFEGEYGELRIQLARWTLAYFERMRDGKE